MLIVQLIRHCMKNHAITNVNLKWTGSAVILEDSGRLLIILITKLPTFLNVTSAINPSLHEKPCNHECKSEMDG